MRRRTIIRDLQVSQNARVIPAMTVESFVTNFLRRRQGTLAAWKEASRYNLI